MEPKINKQKINQLYELYDLGMVYYHFLRPLIDQSHPQLSYCSSPFIDIMLEDIIKSIVGDISFKSASFLRNTGIIVSFDVISLMIRYIKLSEKQVIFFQYGPDVIGQNIDIDNVSYRILENGKYEIFSDNDDGINSKVDIPDYFPENFWDLDDEHFLMLKLML